MDYETFKPSPALAAFIKCFWSLKAPAVPNPEKQRIVPDGCMELIFHCGDLYQQYMPGGHRILQPVSFVFGQITAPLEISPTGKSDILAARFHPDGFEPFTSVPVSEMENKAVALKDLFGEEGHQLEVQVLAAMDHLDRIQLIEQFFIRKLRSPETLERLIRSGIELMHKFNGQVSVNSLAGLLNINRRQLERKFSTTIGISPKQLSKIIRLQSAIKMLEQKQFTNLTSLAYANGYFDQAHFIKDFKELTGMSPKKFYTDSLKMSSLFIRSE